LVLGSDSQRATGGARRNDRQPTERRLAELAAEVGPLRRLLAAVAARLIETRAYERLCYARLSDYGRERAGVSARQLQDLARVHRALGGLPRLERALIANELPWSKVRLVARVATAQDEQAWIARAREVPTRRLEQEVRKRAGGTGAADLEASPPETRVSVRCTPAVCEKWVVAHEMAERVAGQRLRAGEALELVVAEIFSAVSIHPGFAVTADGPAGPRGGAGEPGVGEVTTGERGAARNLSPELASLAEGLDMADAFDLDRRLCLLVGREQTLDATMAPLLRRVSSPEYEWRGDYQTLGGYARNQLGMSASKARALLRIERAAGICPELIGAYRDGRLSWVKAQCLLPLLLLDLPGEWRPAWVAWAQQVTVRRLEQDVARALLLRAGHDRAWRRCKFHPERTQDPIPADERDVCARRRPRGDAAARLAGAARRGSALRVRARDAARPGRGPGDRGRAVRRHAGLCASGMDVAGAGDAPAGSGHRA
jgi:hypothetical protein